MNLNKQDRRTSAPAYLWDNFNFESLKQVLRPRDNPNRDTKLWRDRKQIWAY